MFQIEMLPADHGDCLIITYGDARSRHRILIDGGTASTFNRLRAYIEKLPRKERRFELLIVTHIDSDHLDGIVELMLSDLEVRFDDIWFNGWQHLTPPRSPYLGPRQGDILGNLLSMKYTQRWNRHFGGGTVVVPETGAPPVYTLPGGMSLTLLSPRWKELRKLDSAWIKVATSQGWFPGEMPPTMSAHRSRMRHLSKVLFGGDKSPANGSSIAVIARYQGKSCLLAGDAWSSTLLAGIRRLVPPGQRLELDAFKLPHHGSQGNITAELLEAVKCPRYLISTNGAIFKHPDQAIFKALAQHSPTPVSLYFNYDVPTTRAWAEEAALRATQDDKDLMKKQLAKREYPASEAEGMKIDLLGS
ncbi:ComEC/Rec2 family competence protein [Archangium gephyra]|uniref:ComEC/Rec2 family competence protein n=1 Tax=Archangium gephyra TaxID=48 RepID=UPI003B815EC2